MNSISPEAGAWVKAGRRALLSGSLASVLSTAVLAGLGKRRLGRPLAPTNATSHWLWGDEEAFNAVEPSLRHSAVGYATHHASALMWALFYERWLAAEQNLTSGKIVRNAALMSAIAAFVDYQLTPKRFTPGFEAHLDRKNLLGVFAAVGVGLAAGALLNRRHERAIDDALRIPEEWTPSSTSDSPATDSTDSELPQSGGVGPKH
jgi:hypothetical protein